MLGRYYLITSHPDIQFHLIYNLMPQPSLLGPVVWGYLMSFWDAEFLSISSMVCLILVDLQRYSLSLAKPYWLLLIVLDRKSVTRKSICLYHFRRSWKVGINSTGCSIAFLHRILPLINFCWSSWMFNNNQNQR